MNDTLNEAPTERVAQPQSPALAPSPPAQNTSPPQTNLTPAESIGQYMADPRYLSDNTHEREPIVRQIMLLRQQGSEAARAAAPVHPYTGEALPEHMLPASSTELSRAVLNLTLPKGLDAAAQDKTRKTYDSFLRWIQPNALTLNYFDLAFRETAMQPERYQTAEQARKHLADWFGPDEVEPIILYARAFCEALKTRQPLAAETFLESDIGFHPQGLKAMADLALRYEQAPGRKR